jgi:hypothetical protein
MDRGQKMKFVKWITVFLMALFLILVGLTFNPKTARNLEKNFRNNIVRSFEDSGMPTELTDIEISFWPLLIKWPLLNIARNSDSVLPNSWLQIFQSIKLSNCTLSISPVWFRLNAELQCNKIYVLHLPMRWLYVESLNSSFSRDFYFVQSDFRNLEDKQGWWNMTIKADNLIINGKTISSFHLDYYFSSRKKLVIERPNLKEKMFLINEPEQLRVVIPGVKKNYGFLSQSLHTAINSLL